MVVLTSVPLEIPTALRPLETTNMRQGLASRQVAVQTVLPPAPNVEQLASHQERLGSTRSVALSVRWLGYPAMAPALPEPSSVARFALMIQNKTSTGTAKEYARLGKSLAWENVHLDCKPARMALFV